MKTVLNTAAPSQIETECLVVAVLDAAENTTTATNPTNTIRRSRPTTRPCRPPRPTSIASGEVTGKMLETALSAQAAGTEGQAPAADRRRQGEEIFLVRVAQAGRRCGPQAEGERPEELRLSSLPAGVDEAAKAIVEGAFVGNFDADYYKSDRKDQKIDELTIVTPKGANQRSWKTGMEQGRIIGESQNFTRDLVNEPGNRMTPTIMADRAKAMCEETGLACEIYGPDKIKELKMGAFWSVSQGSDEEPRLIVMRYEPAKRAQEARARAGGQGNYLRQRRHLH